jgi:hypothetical protein
VRRTGPRPLQLLEARIARRYRRTKLMVHVLTLREDGYFWSEGRSGRHTYLLRSGSSR